MQPQMSFDPTRCALEESYGIPCFIGHMNFKEYIRVMKASPQIKVQSAGVHGIKGTVDGCKMSIIKNDMGFWEFRWDGDGDVKVMDMEELLTFMKTVTSETKV